MKRIYLRLAIILLFSGTHLLYSQNETTTTDGNNTTEETTTNDTNTTTEETDSDRRPLNGFDGIAWGTQYQTVKDRFRTLSGSKDAAQRVEILQDVPKKELLIARHDILYRYVFYSTPEEVKTLADLRDNGHTEPDSTDADENKDKGSRFFFAESTFTMVPADDIYDLLKRKYGERTSSTYKEKEMRGAHVWDLDGGYLVQWVNPYLEKPYTRSIYYISKELRDEIKKDLNEYRYFQELKNIENIIP